MIVIFIVILFIILGIGIYGHSKSENERLQRLMEQCLKDHKEYECEAMLRKNTIDNSVYIYSIK